MKIFSTVDELVGKTPLLYLNRYADIHSLSAKLIGKLEFFNPAGSIKDRVVKYMLEKAYKDGFIDNETTIIESTSGNTGIGLAALGARFNVRVIIVMPSTMSVERQKLIKAYGAEVVLTDGTLGIKGSIAKAEQLNKSIPNSFIPSQFTNSANPRAHYETTALEIWEDTDGAVDIVVMGVGTGGTLTGVGRFLKEKNSNIKIVAVEPADSPLLSQGKVGVHSLQGIGPNFVPQVLDTSLIDEIVAVSTDDAFATTRELARYEGVLGGISSGAALFAAKQVAQREENIDKNIVVIFPDSGERYLSTVVFD